MNNGYHKNLVFTAACIGMCFFGVSMITLGSVLPSLVTKLGLSGLQTTSLVTFLPLGMLIGSLIFGPIVDRFGHKALLVPSCIIVLSGLEGLIFFESIPLLQLSIVGIGLGGGILNGETNALVSDISGESEKGSRLSFLGMFYGLGALGIPSLLGVLSEHYSFETILQGIGRNGYGLGRNGIVIHLSGHLEYSRHPLSRIVGNGIQHSARHSSCRTGCHERAYGNGFRICRRHSILSLYDDRFAHYHAYIV